MVTAQPRRGAMVRMIDEQYIENIYELRTAVMSMLLPKAVRYMNNEELEELERLEGKFQRAVAAGNLPETLEARRAFYLFIFRLARNPEALDVLDRSWTVIDILRLRHGAIGRAHV